MTVHLLKALERLKSMLFALSDKTEDQVWRAMKSYSSKDEVLAQDVISKDSEIDQMEIDLEEECLKILSLYQPVAHDLRFVVAALKINNDLERIADLAANLAGRVKYLANEDLSGVSIDLDPMANRVIAMLKDALNAFVEADAEKARNVCQADIAVNKLHKENYRTVAKAIAEAPEQTEQNIALLSISRYLERIGDLATNIAEDAIYLVEGKIVRHGVHE